jgi:Condensation domain
LHGEPIAPHRVATQCLAEFEFGVSGMPLLSPVQEIYAEIAGEPPISIDELPIRNLSYGMLIRGALHAEALIASVYEIVRRHDCLRRVFPAVNGRPGTTLVPAESIEVDQIHISGNHPEVRLQAFRDNVKAEELQPYNLTSGPLIKFKLVHLPPNESVLWILADHSVFDGWSWLAFWVELGTLYEKAAYGIEVAIPSLAMSYDEYAHWARRRLDTGILTQGIEHFRRRLSGAPTRASFVMDRGRVTQSEVKLGTSMWMSAADWAVAIGEFSRQSGVSRSVVLLCGLVLALYQESGVPDVSVLCAVANRIVPQVRNLIGRFSNAVPIRVTLGDDPTFAEVLERSRITLAEAIAFQEVPLPSILQECSNLRPDPFRVMVAFQNFPISPPTWRNATLEDLDSFPASIWDITLSPKFTHCGASIAAAFNETIVSRRGLSSFFDLFAHLLTLGIAEPSTRSRALLLKAQRSQEDKRGTAAGYG